MDIFLSNIYYNKLNYKDAIALFLNVDYKDIYEISAGSPRISETRRYILETYIERYGLIKPGVTQEMCEMVRSKDHDSIKLGIDLLLSSDRPLNHKTFDMICEVLTIIYNSHYCSFNLKTKASIWAYIIDIGDYQNIYLNNICADFRYYNI